MVATQRQYNLLTQLPSGFVRMSAAEGAPSRYRKQVLRIGRYVVGGKPVEITGDDLAALSHNFSLAVARGNKIPVVWGHPENLIDPRSNLGHVESLTLEQGALVAEFSVPDDSDARRINLGIADQVSVGIAPWTDGEGNEYWPMLQHLGVVNLPVMANQEPMTRLLSTLTNAGAKTMSLFGLGKSAKTKKNFADAGGDTAAAMTIDGTATLADAFEAIKAPLESICEAAGVALPGDTTADTLVTTLNVLAGVLGGGESEPDPADSNEGSEAAPAALPEDVGAMPMSTLARRKVSTALSSRDARIKKLELELSTIKQTSQVAARVAFESALDGHIKEGKILPAHRDALLKTGEATGFAMSTLEPFQALPAKIPTGPKATRDKLAMSTVPGGEDKAKAIAEEQAKIEKSWGLAK